MLSKENDKILWICKNKPDDFFNLKNVTGIGLGKKYINSQNTDEFCINVFVEKKEDLNTLKKSDIVPKKYMNIKTDVIEIGKVTGDALTTKIRPVQCGYSIGPVNTNTAGTAGCIVQRGSGNNVSYFILCNNHILTNNQTMPIGTRIIQPSRLDGGTTFDHIANLSNYTTLYPGGRSYNSVDCAIARISNNSLISNEIAWQGYPKGVSTARVGDVVRKVGRGSGRTISTVRSIGTTLYVNLGGQTYLFYDQITINKFTTDGDSGSLVLNSFNQAIGLHMASSGQISIANNINNVLRSLNVELTT